MNKYINIAKNFGIEFKNIAKNENGNINDTFIVTDKFDKKYILQEINTYVFPNVDKLMDNIIKVTEFQRERIKLNGGDTERECINLLKCGDKHYFRTEEGSCWRMYIFIENTNTYQIVENPLHFYNAGIAFGNFQKILCDFPAHELYETIPDFHNTRIRFNNLLKAAEEDIAGRRKEIQNLIDFVLKREHYVDRITNKLEHEIIPYKVTHNDTKFNNVLIDNDTGKGICVIDLDTIMPGSALYDFGDAIRFGTNTAKEDEEDLSKVTMDLYLYEMFTKGYLESLNGTITKAEKDELAFSAILMTLECGMRFLTDYLNGDKYFVIRYKKQNLNRTKTQFKLVTEMEKNFSKMKEIIKKYSN